MDALLQDLRSGARQLFRQRGSSLVAIVTLALGIGVSTAIFSVIDATMLRPLPYPDPEQLVEIDVAQRRSNGEWSSLTASMEDLRAWQAASDVVTHVAGYGTAFRGRIADGAEPERLPVMHFTEDYLRMYGVAPILGRGFTRDDVEFGAPLVALIGYGYWQSRFGGQNDVIGQTIRLDDDVATIIGVLPKSFHASTPVATPLHIDPKMFASRGMGRPTVFARLRPGVSIEQAQAVLSARTPQQTVGRASSPREARAAVTSRLDGMLRDYRTTVNVLVGAVALILLIACVNVAGLLLARGAMRRSELAVRASLGAGRGRLIRQLLTESVVLAVPAGALGVLLAWISLDVLVANIPMRLPADSPVTLNVTVLALTTALLVPTTLLFALAPAIRLSQVAIGSVLARGSRQVGSSLSQRGGQLLIAAEVALAVVLVAGAGLMLRSFARISAVDLGFDTDGLVTMDVLPFERTSAAQKEYYTQLVQRLRTVPGVSSVGLVDHFALGDITAFSSVIVGRDGTAATVYETMPGYLETIGATVRQGRLPSDAEYASGFRVVVVNDSLARELFPDGSAIGRTVTRPGKPDHPWTIVGVVADLRHGSPLNAVDRDQERFQTFFLVDSNGLELTSPMTVVLRTAGDVPGLGDQLRRVAQSIGPRVLVERIRSANDLFGERVITPKRRTVLLGLLGALGLVLALVGVFGMTAYAVSRRTSEIGVRMAFGARPGQVVRTIVRDSALPIAVGVMVGVGASLLATRTIESFLFQTQPNDPATLAAVAVVLAVAGGIAALVPALRAAKIDPATSLRAD